MAIKRIIPDNPPRESAKTPTADTSENPTRTAAATCAMGEAPMSFKKPTCRRITDPKCTICPATNAFNQSASESSGNHLRNPGAANPITKNTLANRAVFRVAEPAPRLFQPSIAKQKAITKRLLITARTSNRSPERLDSIPHPRTVRGVYASAEKNADSRRRLGSILRLAPVHSHSIVPGGFDVMSYTTRFIPRTSFTIRFEIRLMTSHGSSVTSAVMPSSE
jgi:hypothetical protein